MNPTFTRVLSIVLLLLPALSQAEDAALAAVKPNDYSDATTWLCRPDKKDGACNDFQNVLIVAADGSVTPQHYKADADARIDCFYVYPTSSEDRTPNSDMHPGSEIKAASSQFGQFGSKCRQFAPMYRSITLRGLRAELMDISMPGIDHELPYQDVLDAWKYYLAHDNQGRGVVLIGHSQGAKILTRLIQNEIESKPLQKQMVSAILLGANVMVPAEKEVGGTFKSIPLCTKSTQFGCVIAYQSYRSTLPPPSERPAIFGRSKDNMIAACTNPAVLGSNQKAQLDSYFVTGATTWTTKASIDTPFVRVPGLITGQCVTHGNYHYLEITILADATDPRADDIPGDLIVNGAPDPLWGLHKIDVALTMGNLLDVVGQQSKAWLAAKH